MTTMLTWQAEDGHGLEGARVSYAHGLRVQGRMVRPDFTASYLLVADDNGVVTRFSVTTDTAERERTLVMNRNVDGYWLLDTGGGPGNRTDLGGALDVDVEHSPLFNALPIRRLGLNRSVGEYTLPMAFVTMPELEVRAVQQTYRTISLDSGDASVIGFSWDDFSAELVVDADGMVTSYPGIATRLTTTPAG